MENQISDDRKTKQVEESKTTEKHHISEKLAAGGWGLFFLWLGIAFLAKVGMGIGLLGVGIITLGGQVARKYFKLKLEGFYVVVGSLFLAGGIWELYTPKVSLVPILLIAAGCAMIVSVFLGKHRLKK
jgi:hypothetical protein